MDRLGLTYDYSSLIWKHKATNSFFTLEYLNSKDNSSLQTELFKITGFVLDPSELAIMRKPPVQLDKELEVKNED
jgi:hypothetical protein